MPAIAGGWRASAWAAALWAPVVVASAPGSQAPWGGLLGQPEVVLFDDLGAASADAASARLGLPRPAPWPPGRGAPLDEDNDWLRKWLASLEVHIPTTSLEQSGFSITISRGLCRHFEIDDVYSSLTPDPGFKIGVTGLHVFCQLHWEVHPKLLPSLSSTGEVIAEVSNSSAGGPIKIESDNGSPPLPKAIKAYGCESDIQVTSLTFEGSVIAGALEILSGTIKSILNKSLKKVVCTQVDGLINEQGSEFLRNSSREIRSFLVQGPVTPTAPNALPQPESDFANFRQNSGVQALDLLINGALGNATSPFSLKVITSLLMGQDGRLSFDKLGILPVSKAFDVGDLGVLNISVLHATAEGLNSWSELSLSQPGPHAMGLGVGLEKLKVNLTLKLQATPNRKGPLHGQTLSETFSFAVGLSSFGANGSFFLAMNASELGGFAIDQLPQMGCLALATPQALMMQAALGATGLKSQMEPASGSSLEQHLDQLINMVASTLMTQFGAAIGAVANHALKVNLRDMLNKRIDQELAFAPPCADPLPIYAAFWLGDTARFIGAVLVALALLLAIVSKVRHRKKQNSQRSLASFSITPCLSCSSDQVSQSLVELEASPVPPAEPGAAPPTGDATVVARLEVPPDVERQQKWDCLAFHPRTARALRWALPLIIVMNMTLFVSSNSCPGTNIRFFLKANGEDVAHFPPLKQYTLVGSMKEMFESKAYALAALIVVFSGSWPYIKLLMMLHCWFAPTRILSVARRNMVLNFLDAYGKWSLVDMFVMVIMMVAFDFDLSSSSLPVPLLSDIFSSVGASFEFRVYAEPTLSFNTFVIATVCSLILGHTMSGCHRWAHKLCEYAAPREDAGSISRLCNKLRPEGLEGKLYVYGPAVTLSISGLLVLIGVLLETFNFTFLGLSGLLLGEDGRVRPFSVASLALAVPESSPEPDSATIRFVQCTFVLFTMVFAFIYPITLTVLWCAPLSDKVQRRLLVSSQIMNAWNSLDVFVVSLLAGVLEIERFALAVIGDKCDPINHTLQRFPSIVDKMHGMATCFDVTTTLKSGYFLLAAAAIIEAIAGGVVLSRCVNAFCTPAGSPATSPAATAPVSRDHSAASEASPQQAARRGTPTRGRDEAEPGRRPSDGSAGVV